MVVAGQAIGETGGVGKEITDGDRAGARRCGLVMVSVTAGINLEILEVWNKANGLSSPKHPS